MLINSTWERYCAGAGILSINRWRGGVWVSRTALSLVVCGRGGVVRNCGRFTKPSREPFRASFTSDSPAWPEHYAVSLFSTDRFCVLSRRLCTQTLVLRVQDSRRADAFVSVKFDFVFCLVLVLFFFAQPYLSCVSPPPPCTPPWIWFGLWAWLWASAPGSLQRSGTAFTGTAATRSKSSVIAPPSAFLIQCLRTRLKNRLCGNFKKKN